MSDPAMALLNHVMKCAYCYPRSEKYCLVGSKLHKESQPSVDSKKVREMNNKINVRAEGNKILFYREGEDDWFFGTRIENEKDLTLTLKRLGFNPWFTDQLQVDFYDICKNLISENSEN